MFFGRFLCQSNYNRKKLRYRCLAVGWKKISDNCLSCQNTNTNYHRKKIQPEKRYSHLAVSWNTCQNTNTNYDQKITAGNTRYAWAGGTIFQLCCCVSFLFWREIGFDFTYFLCN